MLRVFSLHAIALLSLAANAVKADDSVTAPECSADICFFNVIKPKVIDAPCVGASVLVAYSKSSGTTIIQCSKPFYPDENKILLYDRFNQSSGSFELEGGRFLRTDFFLSEGPEGIPDKFGPVPLCGTKHREPPADGVLALVKKRPNNSEEAPYCYETFYARVRKGLTLQNESGQEQPPASKRARAKWHALQRKISSYIK
ncbi:hypothetical protein LPW11_16755 [Geomonas sp. RF6]|uniref:hypothetical protein n=1 Tax=Geomonas sp. RF6 TaxID=2897342 RepID=UPI001E2C72B9|nr:hypothetical protein [Geomonas sp. RF6]UFS69537.1 hypothetical protein LPW11_16755 [Geomonas sp. RF6]